jgi:TolA-binding protein
VELPGGQALADLGPGQSWSTPEPSAAVAETEASVPERESPKPPPSVQAEAPDIALAEARRLLAAGKAPAARRVLGAVLAGPLSPSLEAEARSLLAECALVGGDEAEAARRYADVAQRFPGSPAGETALFAAARAEQDAGHANAARALLRKYLERYPNGRFAVEARARLDASPKKGQ